jgi:hypothetical protein
VALKRAASKLELLSPTATASPGAELSKEFKQDLDAAMAAEAV